MKLDWKHCFKIGVSIFILYLLIRYWGPVTGLLWRMISAAGPLFIGLIIAYIINILMSFYERSYFPNSTKALVKHSRRPVCILLAIVSLLLIVYGIVQLILPELISCGQLLAKEFPPMINKAWSYANEHWGLAQILADTFGGSYISWQTLNIDWQTLVGQIAHWLVSGFSNAMGMMATFITATFTVLVTLLVAIIFALYLLFGKETLLRQVNRIMDHYGTPKWNDKIRYVAHVFNDSFHRFIVGQCTEAVILGVLCMLGMMLFRFPYANMVGTLVGFTALIPVAGAYIGAVVGAFMIFTVSPIKALFFIIFLSILQQLEGNLIYPRVVGASIGLPGIWVLAAITIGGGILGVGGMLLSVPIAAAFYQLLRNDLNRDDEPVLTDVHRTES